jgi:hypothetical protein
MRWRSYEAVIQLVHLDHSGIRGGYGVRQRAFEIITLFQYPRLYSRTYSRLGSCRQATTNLSSCSSRASA